jgi:hypothetical protein
VQFDDLMQVYSSKTDDELLALAASRDSLVEEARPILEGELRRRSLVGQPIPTETEHHNPSFRDTAVGKFLRTVGVFLLNLLVAVFGTAMIESSIWSQIGHPRSVSGVEAREWLLSLAIGAFLGFVVCMQWPNQSAVWVWVLPVAFLMVRVFLYGGSASNSVLVETSRSEHFFAPNCLNDKAACNDFFIFTIPFARTAAYSLAAWISLHFQTRPSKSLSQNVDTSI